MGGHLDAQWLVHVLIQPVEHLIWKQMGSVVCSHEILVGSSSAEIYAGALYRPLDAAMEGQDSELALQVKGPLDFVLIIGSDEVLFLKADFS